jgi:hypothetical protein
MKEIAQPFDHLPSGLPNGYELHARLRARSEQDLARTRAQAAQDLANSPKSADETTADVLSRHGHPVATIPE